MVRGVLPTWDPLRRHKARESNPYSMGLGSLLAEQLRRCLPLMGQVSLDLVLHSSRSTLMRVGGSSSRTPGHSRVGICSKSGITAPAKSGEAPNPWMISHPAT
jgi:hypothetical protein